MKTSSLVRWIGATAALVTTAGVPASAMLRNSAPERAGVATSVSWPRGLRSADISSRGSSSCRTGLRVNGGAAGGFFDIARARAGARAGVLAGVLRVESLARSDGAVETGEERIGSLRLERAREDAGAAFAAPTPCSVRLVLDAIPARLGPPGPSAPPPFAAEKPQDASPWECRRRVFAAEALRRAANATDVADRDDDGISRRAEIASPTWKNHGAAGPLTPRRRRAGGRSAARRRDFCRAAGATRTRRSVRSLPRECRRTSRTPRPLPWPLLRPSDPPIRRATPRHRVRAPAAGRRGARRARTRAGC